MAEWRSETVELCLAPLRLSSATKVQTSEYKRSGLYPIVDQGRAPIAGWTDDASGLIEDDLPVVVFGDHTRALKYVDFPFVRGADGTQILRARSGIEPHFFYYALRALDLPSRGYNRHFKALKEKEIAVPEDTDEQSDVARVLRLVEQCLDLQDEAVRLWDAAKRAAMRELFTRGLRGEGQRETEIGSVPESWTNAPLGKLAKIGNGTTPSRTNNAYWNGGSIPWITSGRMYERRIVNSDTCVTLAAIRENNLPLLRPGTVLMAIVGQGKTLGHCAILDVAATVSRHVGFIELRESVILPEFLVAYFESQYHQLRQLASGNGSTRDALTCAMLRGVQVPIPHIDEQREIVAILDAIDRKIDLHRRKRAVLDELFKALLHRLMTGAIRVADLDLSVLVGTSGVKAA